MALNDTAAGARRTFSIIALLGSLTRRADGIEPLRDGGEHLLADLGLTRGQWARLLRTTPAADRAQAASIARASFRPI